MNFGWAFLEVGATSRGSECLLGERWMFKFKPGLEEGDLKLRRTWNPIRLYK